MKKLLLLLTISFLISSTYDLTVKVKNYDGIRPGTKVKYESFDAGKVKKISENDQGSYDVILKLYDDPSIPKLNENMIFKIQRNSFIVDLDGMEKRKLKLENERLAKIKAKEEAEAKALANAKAMAEAEQKAKDEAEAKAKAAEELRIAKENKKKEKERKLILAAEASPFKGDIDGIKEFQKLNGLVPDGFWGPGTQKVYDKMLAEKIKAENAKRAKIAKDQADAAEKARLAEEQADAAEKARLAEEQADAAEKNLIANEEAKLKDEISKKENEASVTKDMNTDQSIKKSDVNIKSDSVNLEDQYDIAPRLKKKLSIKTKKYKNEYSSYKIYINKKGKVEDIIFIESSNNEKFDKHIHKALKKSKWKPAIKNGETVSIWHLIEIKS